MWDSKIIPSRYAQLPELTSPGFMDIVDLITGHFSRKALATQSDGLEPGRRKPVPAFGAEARLRLIISPAAVDACHWRQPGHNYFSQTFSNILLAPVAFSQKMLAVGFERSAVQFGAKDPNPGRLTLENLAGVQVDGRYTRSSRWSRVIPPKTRAFWDNWC